MPKVTGRRIGREPLRKNVVGNKLRVLAAGAMVLFDHRCLTLCLCFHPYIKAQVLSLFRWTVDAASARLATPCSTTVIA